MGPLRHVLDSVGTPAFLTPESAANAFGILGSYHYNQTLSQQTLPPEPLSKPPLLDQARELVRRAQTERRHSLDADDCRQLLDCFHLPLLLAPGAAVPDDALPMALHVQLDHKFGPSIMFCSGGLTALISGTYRPFN